MEPSEAINYMLLHFERAIFDDYRKIEALFKDLCTDAKYIQEVNTLLVAAKMRIPSKMLEIDKVDSFYEQNSITKMVKDYGIRKDLAFQAVYIWSEAIYKTEVKKYISNSLNELKKYAAKGDPEKQFELGKAYLKGFIVHEDTKEPIEKDLSQAFEWFMKSAKSNHAEAKNYVGVCYDQGMGVTRNYKEAKHFYEQSAKQGNLNALYNLANCYEYGIGVAQNESKAFIHYQKLHEQDYVDAIYKVAWFYENGISISVDKRRALTLYKEAAEKGSSQAQYYLAQSYQHPTKGEPNLDEAKKWYYLAAKNKHPKANFHLSQL